jgi:NADPH-dependent 2,4-dienoyl-CoA reductase/sulfur reductase-like enzyme/nitrite reductase/ring-hydroxylating ferredoxin subunit
MGKKISTSRWVEITTLAEMKGSFCRIFDYGQDRVLVYRSGDAFEAVSAECSHHRNTLEGGMIVTHQLTCPWHGSRFDTSSACCLSPPALDDLQRFDTRVKDEKLFIKRSKPERLSVQLRKESGVYLIVGNGAAGLAAAVTLRREGFNGRLIVITSEVNHPYDRTRLSKGYLSGGIERNDLFLYSEQYYSDMHIELLMGRQVSGLDPGEKQVVFMDGDYLLFDKLLIATGSIPRTPLISGTDLPSFFLLRSLRDADSITGAASDAKRVLVMGAGFIGLEAASVLRERGMGVHVAAPERVLFSNVFGRKIGERVQRLHEAKGVVFHLGKTVTLLRGEGRIQFAQLSDETLLEVDLVLCCIGAIPATHFLEDAGIVEQGAVPVDEHMRTRVEDIYAAGDIAVVRDGQTGEARRITHWTEALQQGQHAARCMLGSEQPYASIPLFWTEYYDSLVRFAGYVPRVGKVLYRGDVDRGEFLAAYFRHGRLCAVCGIGREQEFMALHHLLREGKPPGKSEFKNGTFLEPECIVEAPVGDGAV